MTGSHIAKLMRLSGETIRSVAERMSLPRDRVREIRRDGVDDPLRVRDWIEGITGRDPGQVYSYACPRGDCRSAERKFTKRLARGVYAECTCCGMAYIGLYWCGEVPK